MVFVATQGKGSFRPVQQALITSQKRMTRLARAHLFQKWADGRSARNTNTLQEIGLDQYVPPYARALIHLGLGEKDKVFECLRQAFEVRDVHLNFLPVDPKWNELRSDDRFVGLLTKCNFYGQ
jgi:hypothetical protein